MARALVIGGTAFMGRAIVERLLARGDDVVVMHRAAGTPFGSRVSEIRCDRNDVAGVRRALGHERFDLAFDMVYDWARGTPPEAVLAAADSIADGLTRYVFTSSVAAYGDGAAHDERDSLAPPDHPSDYVRQKAETERALFARHARQGLPVTTLRPSYVYGPHNPFDREAFFWDRIIRDRPVIVPGDGSRLMQWVMADDVARTAVAAAGVPEAAGKAYNLGTDPPITQADFVRLLGRVAGREARLVFVPRERIAAAGGGVAGPPLYFGMSLDLPPITMRAERVRTELGVALTPLDEGLRATFEWYVSQARPAPDFSWEDRLLAGA